MMADSFGSLEMSHSIEYFLLKNSKNLFSMHYRIFVLRTPFRKKREIKFQWVLT